MEPAHESDAKALMPAIESVAARGLEPKEIDVYKRQLSHYPWR